MPVRERRILGAVLIISLALAGCGGGGGGNLAASIPVAMPAGTSTGTGSSSLGSSSPPPPSCVHNFFGSCLPTITTQNEWLDTGYMGSVAAPAPPSFGSSSVPPETAAVGGPSSVWLSNVRYPVLQTSLQFGSAGISAVPGDQSATLVVGDILASGDGAYQLNVPSIGLTTIIRADNEGSGGFLGGLQYFTLGEWDETGGHPGTLTEFLFGLETPAAAIPAGGKASYSGSATGRVYVPVDGHILGNFINGNAALSVDFASGIISGALIQTVATNPTQTAGGVWITYGASYPWNDVSISASIAAGTTGRFSGTTAATSAPQNQYALQPSATGSIAGALYGPNAEEIGAIWTLSDGTASAVGFIGAEMETPATAVPVTGMAVFSGNAISFVSSVADGQILGAMNTNMSLTADFASGAITGAIRLSDGGPVITSSNDISVNATIAGGSNKFSGVTAVTSSNGPLSLSSSATGTVTGQFYRPGATLLGGAWTLGDGKLSTGGNIWLPR